MSFLTATIMGAALLGADPQVVTSVPPVTEVQPYTAESPVAEQPMTEPMTEPMIEGAEPSVQEAMPQSDDPTFANSPGVPGAYCPDPAGGAYCEDGFSTGLGGIPNSILYGIPYRGPYWGSPTHTFDCNNYCWNSRLVTYCVGPGNLHPHYPYFPIYHGYYYFRPYNFTHVRPAAALAAQMGGDPKAPYSVAFLKPYFPIKTVEPLPVIPVKDRFPLLEDVLTSKGAVEDPSQK